jgi:hypothetical protein
MLILKSLSPGSEIGPDRRELNKVPTMLSTSPSRRFTWHSRGFFVVSCLAKETPHPGRDKSGPYAPPVINRQDGDLFLTQCALVL